METSFDPICPKTLCNLSPTLMMLHIKFDQDWPTGLRDIQVSSKKLWQNERMTESGRTKSIFHSCEVQTEISVSRVTVWHHEALPSDAIVWPERWKFLSVPNNYDWYFFLHNIYVFISCNKSNQKGQQSLTWVQCAKVNLPQNLMQPFPYPNDATHKIWSRLADWLQRYSSSKV